MNTSNIFNIIFDKYSSLKINKQLHNDVYQIEKIAYYYADSNNYNVSVDDLYLIDLKSAFPSLCKLMFGMNSQFVKDIEKQNTKFDKNKFIAISLKNTPYLKELNLLSKMIVTSCVISNDINSEIFELKKDGILYKGKNINFDNIFYKYYTEKLGLVFHIDHYKRYYRNNKTSYYLNDNNELEIKGVYKDRPEFLENIALKILVNDIIDYNELFDIYSYQRWKIIQKFNLDELFIKYFICNNNKYLDYNLKYQQIKTIEKCNIFPKNYLKLFIYPLFNFK